MSSVACGVRMGQMGHTQSVELGSSGDMTFSPHIAQPYFEVIILSLETRNSFKKFQINSSNS